MSLWFHIINEDQDPEDEFSLYEKNATHNLIPMWKKANLYKDLYDSDGLRPQTIIANLRRGLADMQDNPDTYRALEPSNGWGTYENAIDFLQSIITACAKYPTATISISK